MFCKNFVAYPFEKATGLDTKRSNLTQAPDFFQETQQLRFQPLQCNVLGLCYSSAMMKKGKRTKPEEYVQKPTKLVVFAWFGTL